jgi:hypothetical protein
VLKQVAIRAIALARRTRASWVTAFAAALFVVAIATIFRWVLTPLGLESTPFITYFPAVLVATLFGGAWGGLVAHPGLGGHGLVRVHASRDEL